MKKKNVILWLLFVLICSLITLIYFVENTRCSPKYLNETFINNNSNAFCLLTREPSIIWLDFLNTFTDNYNVFIAIDNQNDYTSINKKYPKITFIQISDEECNKANYTNSDYFFKPIVSTDRAFYYFNRINTSYKHIWFCEDDVYIHNINDIITLDNQYPSTDLIVPNIEMNKDGNNDGWPHWQNIDNTLPLPWAHHIICIARISRELMNKVDEFVKKHNKLIYKEILFHTLALHNDMSIETPKEMSKIRYPQEWDILDVINDYNNGAKYIYHPIKDLQKQVELRNQ